MGRTDRKLRRARVAPHAFQTRKQRLEEDLRDCATPEEKLKRLNKEYGDLMDRILRDPNLSDKDRQDLLREMVVSSDLAQMPEEKPS